MNCGGSSEAGHSVPYVFSCTVMENPHTNRREKISNNNPLNNTVFADLGLDD